MTDLYLHDRKLHSIFELLGTKENDITFSVGWALAQSPVFLKAMLHQIFPMVRNANVTEIRLQRHRKLGGITDVEIINPEVHAIIEAKRGWTPPGLTQLRKYAEHLRISRSRHKALVVMAECSPEYAALHVRKSIGNIPVHYFSWKNVDILSKLRTGSHAEKRMLQELRVYLRRIVNMQNQESNMVYVLAIAAGTPSWSKISWRDIVNVKRRYFHPFGTNGWPKDPPNYLGFRYDGRLQSIHHVDSWKVVTEMHSDIPEIKAGKWGDYLLYKLGPPIIPSKIIKTGKIFRNGRVWAMLDLLFSCKTIAQARNRTKKRIPEIY